MVFHEVSWSSLRLGCDVLHGCSLVVHLVVRWCWSVVVCWWSLVVRSPLPLRMVTFKNILFFFSVKDIRSVVSEPI